MLYEPLHHKYRPQTFGELIGQDAIAKTLSNALLSRRIAPAYLFTGPRGTGKTSSARILAKSLNCLASEVPTPTPCGKCEVCRAITVGSALDVIEIDAASNTGVDNIREIIERSQFAPVQCRYKVYVIDECLTGDALVLTDEGLMRIDDPKLKGKQVLSYNESSETWEYKKVLRWIERGIKPTLKIKTQEREIHCTDNHLIRTEQGWIQAKNIKVGMKILSPVNMAKWLTNLETVESVKVAATEDVYDIEVEDNHNFVANGLLVHNCHMLSTAAFNALLKTLEEPPDRVVFVLATTDPQRVLPTIISRCQRFDYRRIPLKDMVEHLSKIAYQEAIDIDPEAMTLIAQIANGGLRDAQSLLDQLSLFSGIITPETVWELVGAVPERDLLTLLQAIHSNHPEKVIEQCRHLMNRGREPLVVLQNLASFYLNLLIAKTAPHRPDMVAVTAPTWQNLCQEATFWELNEILKGQQYLKDSESQLKNTTQPRLWLEVTLLSLLPLVHSSTAVSTQTVTLPPPSPPELSKSEPVPQGDQNLAKRMVDPIQDEPISIPTTPEPIPDLIVEPIEDEPEAIPTPTPNLNLQQIWQQVLRIVPMATQSLLKEHGCLLSLDNSVAEVSITSEPLLKMARPRLTNIEDAFSKICRQPIKVNLQVASLTPSVATQSPIPEKAPESVIKPPEIQSVSTHQNNPPVIPPQPKIEKPTLTPVAKLNPPVEPVNLPPPETDDDSDDVIKAAAESLAKFFEGEIVMMSSKITEDEATESEEATTVTTDAPSNQLLVSGRPDLSDIADDEDIPFLRSIRHTIVGDDDLYDPWEIEFKPFGRGLQGLWSYEQ